MPRPFRFPLPALLLAAAAASAAEVPVDRRSRDEPEIIVEAGGRTGRCDSLQFTADGKYLVAGGDDKVVRVWPYADGKLDTAKGKARVLRWPAWREQRGGVKAVAVSADGSRVVVGGFGMRSSTVALLDGESGDLIALTYPVSTAKDNFVGVYTIALPSDPKDPRVAFGTGDGSVWVWDTTLVGKEADAGRRTAPPVRVGVHEKVVESANNVERSVNFPRGLWFEGNDKLLSFADSGQFLECDVPAEFPANGPRDVGTGKPRTNVFLGVLDDRKHAYAYRVAPGPVIADGKGQRYAVACRGEPLVVVRSSRGGDAVQIKLPEQSVPQAVAFDPKTGRLAVAVGDYVRSDGATGFVLDGPGRVLVYDTPTATPKKIADIPFPSGPDCVAFHPTDGRLAVAGGDNAEVAIYDVDKPAEPVSVVRGAGRGLWQVGLSPNGGVLGVRAGRDPKATDPNARGAGPWAAFDLPRMKAAKDPAEWVTAVREADGWRVVPEKSNFVWSVERKGANAARYVLPLDRDRDQMPLCYTFVPAKNGAPTRLLVGHYYGVTMFEFRDTGLVAARLFTGHAGEVTSVAAAKDGTWFVSAGSDQTVAAFSLADWPSQPNLGAAVAVADDKLVVKKVDLGSPAWEAGLTAGDVIEFLAVGRKPEFSVTAKYPKTGDAAAAKRLLDNARPGIEQFIGYRRQGKGDLVETLTTVRQRPLWKWFPAFDDAGKMTDWVVWMWRGSYYHTKTAHGDRLVGWHVNHPRIDGKPEFYQLQQFEKQYHRPEILTKLIASRDVAAVLVSALGENPQRVPFDQFEPAPVRLAVAKSTVGEAGLSVGVTVKARGTNPDLLPERVELWINDYRHKVWDAGGRAVEETIDLPADVFRGGENQISVQTFNGAGGRAEAVKIVTNPRDSAAPRLLGFAVGVNDYAAHRVSTTGARSFGDLKSARNDAEALAGKLLDYRGEGKHFPAGGLDVRLDAQARRADLLASLDKFAKDAKADDQLVIFFAGHGDFVIPDANAVGTPDPGARGAVGGRGLFLFCCPDYAPAKPRQTALAAEELFDKIATIKCRKVVLLDACHSGQATDANLIRRFVPNGHGPFVMASSDQSELSYEHPKFGHGLFTYAVMEALGDRYRKADRDTDGSLTTAELFQYVSNRMPDLLRETGKDAGLQNPICFPRDPTRTVFVRR